MYIYLCLVAYTSVAAEIVLFDFITFLSLHFFFVLYLFTIASLSLSGVFPDA